MRNNAFYVVCKKTEGGKYTPAFSEGFERDVALKKSDDLFLRSGGKEEYAVFECRMIHASGLIPHPNSKPIMRGGAEGFHGGTNEAFHER